MKAAQFSQYGEPEVIEINEVSKPVPTENQVLIEVHVATINPFDYKLRRGYMKDMMPLTFPFTIGGDLSGVVVEIAKGVSNFNVGDEVFGQAYNLGGSTGSMAEFAAANVESVALKPKTINYVEAGSLPLVGCSAIQSLEQHINLQNGQKILIHGGAGGIGSVAIQLAKHLGAYVATTVSTDDIDFAKTLGADEVIDYKSQDFSELLKDFDAVYDTVGGDTTDRSFKILTRGGILVSMLGAPKEELATEYGVTVIGQNTQTNSQNLSRLAELVDQGVIKPEVDKVFPLAQVREAFEYAENGHPRGKVVIAVKE